MFGLADEKKVNLNMFLKIPANISVLSKATVGFCLPRVWFKIKRSFFGNNGLANVQEN